MSSAFRFVLRARESPRSKVVSTPGESSFARSTRTTSTPTTSRLAITESGDPADPALSNYEEAIRTLRNSILLTDFDRRLRSVLLTSASPSAVNRPAINAFWCPRFLDSFMPAT